MDEKLQIMEERLLKIESLLKAQKSILNINEVAELTGLSKSTIYKMTCTLGIPHYKKAKHLYFDREEIENWLKSNKIETSEVINQKAATYCTLNNK